MPGGVRPTADFPNIGYATWNEDEPPYRLYAGEIELGAAWARVGRDSGRSYFQVRLDDPSFPAPVFANLIEDEATGRFSLIWNRPKAAKPAKAPRRGGATARGGRPVANSQRR